MVNCLEAGLMQIYCRQTETQHCCIGLKENVSFPLIYGSIASRLNQAKSHVDDVQNSALVLTMKMTVMGEDFNPLGLSKTILLGKQPPGSSRRSIRQ